MSPAPMRFAPAEPEDDPALPFPIKCVELVIENKSTRLEADVQDGRIVAIRSESPAGPGGGRVLAIVEPYHAEGCAVETGGRCQCGAVALFEAYIRR